jgi:oligosaccharide repeat unit polymerase
MANMLLVGLFIAVTCILIFISKKLYQTMFAPLGLYAVIWGSMGAIYHLKLLPYPDLRPLTIGVIFLSWFSFSIACISIGLLRVGSIKKNRRRILIVRESLLRRAILATSIPGFVGGIVFLGKVVGFFGVMTIIEKPWLVRYQLTIGGEALIGRLAGTYLLSFSFASAVLSAIYLGTFSGHWPFAYLPLSTIIVYDFAYLGRTYAITAMMLYLSGLFLTRRTLRKPFQAWLKISLVILTVIGFVIFMGEFTGRSKSEMIFISNEWLASLVHLLNRLSGPLMGLDEVVHLPSPFLLGQESFRPFVKWLHEIGLFDNYVETAYLRLGVDPLFGFGESYLTFTYLRSFYDDFDLLGIVLGPYLLGFLSSLLFLQSSPNSLITLTFLYGSILFSFGDWMFWNPYYVLALLIANAVSILVGRKSR